MRNHLGIVVMVALLAAATPAAAAELGFVSLFDGKTLSGWSCPEMKYWSVNDGAITARNAQPIKECYYLVWQGGRPADFELKAKFRIQGSPEANSGIQFRSKVRPDGFVEGYQADITREPKYCGALYDETPKRGLLAEKGQRVVIDQRGRRKVEQFADAADLWKKIDLDGWNEYDIIARGPHVSTKINGHLMWEVIDRQKGRHAGAPGVIALQLHVGPPMQVQFKDIRLKVLTKGDVR
jgi:hypothetical protein